MAQCTLNWLVFTGHKTKNKADTKQKVSMKYATKMQVNCLIKSRNL